MRLIITHGLKPRFFVNQASKAGKGNSGAKSETDKMLELLKFDALTLSEEVESTRRGQAAYKTNLTAQERIVIHMCYLLTTRFEEEYAHVLKLI